ncbi:IclR family transcriptional regulator [Paralysiella testudinis]|uniref:DNA-binding protein n=1 Tax=Paralysiella testudinis TaxID=2809020 RepID=A0A892ZK64_9NEIS|nr:DNA-binding protein [Paralysiella testudinis]QRQ82086.1 DNA-binding protein [Paralysiella testudinis]
MAASTKGQRLLAVFKALEGHPIIGISNKTLSDGLDMSAAQVSRDLDDLIVAGLVQKLDNGHYAYSIKTLQIAERFRRQQEAMQNRLNEIGTRVDNGSFS